MVRLLQLILIAGTIADTVNLDDKKKGTDTSTANSVAASPGPIVNQLDDSAKETFATGRPLEDTPKIQICKHCKKSFLITTIPAHLIACLKAKKEKAQRKKEQKEARERERRGIDAESKKDDEGDRVDDDDDDAEEDASPEKKFSGGLKSSKKSAGKKLEIDDSKKGKKRKADGDAEKGPKQKKKKEEPKPKAPKSKGNYFLVVFHIQTFPLSSLMLQVGACYGHVSLAGSSLFLPWSRFFRTGQSCLLC
jgi:SAGA-associated factor 73